MKKMKKLVLLPVFVLMLVSIISLTVKTAAANSDVPGDKDLKVNYGAKNTIVLFSTQNKKIAELTGKTGQWENSETYQSYIWAGGEAAFLLTGKKKNPELVRIVLNKNFKTPKGIVKGSTFDELIKVYSQNYELNEGGNGNWYVFKWDSVSTSKKLKGKKYSISFYIVDDLVDSVMLKLENKETDQIPLG